MRNVRLPCYMPTLVGGVCLLVSACASDGGAAEDGSILEPDAGASVSCITRTRTCAEIQAAFAEVADSDVTVECDADSFTVSASGVPMYTSNQSTPNEIGVQGWVVTLPLTPSCAAEPEDAEASRGPIGIMVNGVVFFGPQNIAGEDAVVAEGPTLDDCDGHADMMCVYHYHSDATCVFGLGDTLEAHAGDDGHPAIIGFAFDGFALHAPDPAATLDACNGHVDDARGYHYHASATFPYFLGCFGGTRVADAHGIDLGCD